MLVEAEGPPDVVAAFVARLRDEAPPLADVRGVEADGRRRSSARPGFAIVASAHGGAATAPVTPDSATCDGLPRRARRPGRSPLPLSVSELHELRAALHDRPRHPVRPAADDDGGLRHVRRVPGRVRGSAGPPLPRAAQRVPGLRAAGAAARARRRGGRDGRCRARRRRRTCSTARSSRSRASAATTSPAAPTTRTPSRCCAARKHREDRPFALLVADVEAARAARRARRARGGAAASRASARSCWRAGFATPARARIRGSCRPMRPPARPPRSRRRSRRARRTSASCCRTRRCTSCSPTDAGVPLVMTSGNVSDEPIAFDDADALERLDADRRPLPRPRPPDRDAHRRLGRARRPRAPAAHAPLARLRARRARPARSRLTRHILGTGAEQKNAFCVAKGDRAWPQPPHRRRQELRDADVAARRRRALRGAVRGDARGRRARPASRLPLDALRARARGRRARRRPAPSRPSRRDARRARRDRPRRRRDLRRHRLRRPTARSGAARSSSAASREFERAGRLAGVRMPGGEGAIREPWRMACSWLTQMREPLPAGVRADRAAALEHGRADGHDRASARRRRRARAGCSTRSRRCAACASRSATRVRPRSSSRRSPTPARPSRIRSCCSRIPPAVMNPQPAILAVLADLAAGVPVSTISARFHAGLARRHRRGVRRWRRERAEVDLVVLSGGVFQNRLLLELTSARLEEAGLRVLVPERLPPNDGQIAFGQVAVAAAQPPHLSAVPQHYALRHGQLRAQRTLERVENLGVMVRGRARRGRGRPARSARVRDHARGRRGRRHARRASTPRRCCWRPGRTRCRWTSPSRTSSSRRRACGSSTTGAGCRSTAPAPTGRARRRPTTRRRSSSRSTTGSRRSSCRSCRPTP